MTVSTVPSSAVVSAPESASGELARDLRERAGLYRTLAELYFTPLSQERLDAMDADALAILAGRAEDPLMAEGFNDMYRYLRRRNSGMRQELNVDFTGAFYGANTYEGLTAEPYASLYLSPEGTLMGPTRTSMMVLYRRFGVEVCEGLDLPEDHLTFQLELIALMYERAADALEAGRLEEARGLLEQAGDVLERQVLSWFGRFFNLSNKLLHTRFYQGVNKVAKAFLLGEGERLAKFSEQGGGTVR